MIFSSTDAAFEGFRVTRRHPVAVLVWAAIMLVANIGSALAVGLLAGPAWGQLEVAAAAEMPDQALLSQLLPHVLPAALLSMAIQAVAASAVNASVLRALLRPERRAFLSLGRDEVRVIGLLILFVFVNFLASIALTIVFGLVGGVLGAAAGPLAKLASAAVLVVLAVRFSLAGPMTIAEHRFRFRESWRETRGWFWQLLGAELLAAALALVVATLVLSIFFGLAGVIIVARGGNLFADFVAAFSPDFSSVDKLLAPLPLLYVGFLSIAYALALVIMVAPPVELYRRLKAGAAGADVA